MSATQTRAVSITVPDDLSELNQWIMWRSARDHKGSLTKVPFTLHGKYASSTDPATWTSFEAVMRCWKRFPKHFSGVGFVFSATDLYCGIDLDDCLDGADQLKPWACGIIERFADTYMEISPSGRGLKCWARGSLPANLPKVKIGDGGIELYDHARYFTVTGRVFRDAPLQVEEHTADLLALYQRLTANRKKDEWRSQPLGDGRIPYGQQHSTLVSLVGTLRARRVCDEAIEACLQVINERQCERPGARENISRIVWSSRHWGITA